MTILISGNLNVETTVQVDQFPISYEPVHFPFFGLKTAVSGVGYNLGRALKALGHSVQLASMIGSDLNGRAILQTAREEGFNVEHIISDLPATAQSVVLYDREGRRQLHIDLKDIQERQFPAEQMQMALAGAKLIVLSPINYNRALLPMMRASRIPIAIDVHAISDLDDSYNYDFMAAADILFMSHERIPIHPKRWLHEVRRAFPNAKLIAMGMGADGAIALDGDGPLIQCPAVLTRKIVNTVGAGDALFAAFLHGRLRGLTTVEALEQATVFASYKIGAQSASEGFLDARSLEQLWRSQGGRAAPPKN